MPYRRTTLSKFIIEEQRRLACGAELIALVNDIRAIVGLPPLVADDQGNVKEDPSAAGGAIVDADRAQPVGGATMPAGTPPKPREFHAQTRQHP